MGVSLETWRARIGTFPQRPRPKKSSAPMCVGRDVMAGLPGITLLKYEEKEGWRDKKETSSQGPRSKNSRAVLNECREFIAGLLGLTLLLSLCQLNVGTHSLTFDHELLCSIRTPPTGTRVCTFSTSNTQYPTTTLEFWNLAGDDSSKIGQKGCAMSRRLLMLSGDVEMNPGPNQEQAPRSVSCTPIEGSPWCLIWMSDNRMFFHNPTQQLSVWQKPAELEDRTDVDTLTLNAPVSHGMTASAPMTKLHKSSSESQLMAAQQRMGVGDADETTSNTRRRRGVFGLREQLFGRKKEEQTPCNPPLDSLPEPPPPLMPRQQQQQQRQQQRTQPPPLQQQQQQQPQPHQQLRPSPPPLLLSPQQVEGAKSLTHSIPSIQESIRTATESEKTDEHQPYTGERLGLESQATLKTKPVSNNPMSSTQRVAALMSDEDNDLLTKSLPHLIRNIGIEDGMLLAHLRSRGALTQQQEDYIKSKGDRNNQVGCLLDVLLKRDSNTVDKLIYSLRDTGQSNIVDKWLRPPRELDNWEQADPESTGVGATNSLSGADINMLEKQRPRITGSLKLTDGSLLAELRSRGVVTEPEEGYIKGITGNTNAAGYLVDLVLRKTTNSLEEFLHALNHSGHSSVVECLRQPTTLDQNPHYVRGGSSTTELENALRENLADRLNDWKTALEEDSGGQEPLQYIDQPCTVRTKDAQESTMDRAIQVVEESVPGDRIVVYGEAGSGKTTLLKQLARSWIEKKNPKLVNQFKYLFLIPCRLIGNMSLLSIICEELKLINKTSRNELEKSLGLNERKVIFLIDSFEELRGDVAKAKVTEINNLISGRIWQKSTVIVTSRPGSRLSQPEHQKTAHLKDLPEDKVKEIIGEQLKDQDAAESALQAFPAMSFLQKPINLALFLYIVKLSKHLQNIVSFTQAELFSQVLQFIMLAFTKKKKWEEFTPQPGSYIRNRDIPTDTRSRFREIAKKCFEERKQNNVILHIEESDDITKYLEFGLFTAGPDNNSVLLPHPLFQEYFAAAHLAEDSEAWAALFEKIKEKSESGSYRASYRGFQFVSGSDRPLLVGVLSPMGLNNVVRFLVALKPQVCQQIGELFVVERYYGIDQPCDNYRPVNLEYYTELIRACSEDPSEDNGKRVLATALVNAPLRKCSDQGHRGSGFMDLWPHLTYDQRCNFLRNVYKFDLHFSNDRVEISCTGENRCVQISDNFVATFIYLYDCIINTDMLIVEGVHPDLPASMVSRNIPTVHQLKLKYCTLCKEIPDYIMSDTDRVSTIQHSSPWPTNSSLERVWLETVEGLEHCDVITSHQCQLVMSGCGDVRASTLKTCFPRVSELEFKVYGRKGKGKDKVVYETEEELTSWLSSVQTVRTLPLAPQHEGESLSLSHLLNILAEKQLEYLRLDRHRSTLLLDVRESDKSDSVKQNNTMSTLRLRDCKGDVDLGQLLEICSRQCPQLERVAVERCQLQVIVRDISDTAKQNNTLSELELQYCEGDVDLGQLLEVCSRQCPQLKVVTVRGCQLQVIVRDISDTAKQNNTLSKLELKQYHKGDVDLGQLLEVCGRQCPQLKEVMVESSNLVFDDEKVESVNQLPGLQWFSLKWSAICTPAGRILSRLEEKQLLHRMCPSAKARPSRWVSQCIVVGLQYANELCPANELCWSIRVDVFVGLWSACSECRRDLPSGFSLGF